jgi:hypothetical protein
LRSATLLVVIVAAAACGSSSSQPQSPPGSTLCIGATAPKPLATLSGFPRSIDVRDGRLAVASTDSTLVSATVSVVDLADGTVRTLASGRPGADFPAIGPEDAYWMEPGGHVRAPLDGSGTPETVLSIVAGAYDMIFDGSTLYFAYYPDNAHTVVASLIAGAGTATDLASDVGAALLRQRHAAGLLD